MAVPAKLYPLLFQPIYKKKIWGGRLLGELFDRELPAGSIGESWDVAAHPEGSSVVCNGPLAGRTLKELVKVYGEELVGAKGVNPQGKFPLLFKLIQAEKALSVQVHPPDEYAAAEEGEPWGKTEMWYIVKAEPEAWIIWGLRPGVSQKQLEAAAVRGGGALLNCLNKINVKAGELYPISAGLVHALGPGVVVAEIQQNSDLTYRLYDWDRRDGAGKSRDLHLRQALAVIDFSARAGDKKYQLQRCEKYFRLRVLTAPHCVEAALAGSFHLLTTLDSPLSIFWGSSEIMLQKGQSCLIPAALKKYSLQGEGIVLKSKLS